MYLQYSKPGTKTNEMLTIYLRKRGVLYSKHKSVNLEDVKFWWSELVVNLEFKM